MSSPTDLAAKVASSDPDEGMRAVVALRELLERLEFLHVRRAREQGRSWEHIARALGVSRQAVHQKHGHRLSDPTKD